uniref:Cytochrome c oxidase subunit 2 n=1 Tax=Thyreophagus entomophagus TaxID=2874286 RepID=A0A977KCZ9_9ACAR|nr:cytochrome c oxidase subunit II [Thyreophagus entomophagus]UXD78881.1 cytochrome c oxidase subunit II [Thyreophagus entomophagus]
MPSWLALGFQDSSSPMMGELSYLHDHVMTIMFSVLIFISYITFYVLFTTKFYKFLSEGTFVETIWSMVPAFLLIILVLPSMKVLYMMEDVKNPSLTFKIVAHQWYWTYVVPLFKNFSFLFSDKGQVFSYYEFDSVLDGDDYSGPRLLGCSSDLFIPVGLTSRFLITSTDVIHSFSLPVLGMKVDALPGRINQLFAMPSRLGHFYGQCSEICGSNHSFMPISLKVCGIGDFDSHSKLFTLDFFGECISSSIKL